jgi:hypothetical protein
MFKINFKKLFHRKTRFQKFVSSIKKGSSKLEKRHKLGIAVLFLIFLSGAFYYSFSGTEPASAGWWNDDWMYRKEIVITENSGNNLSDYPIYFDIDTSSLISAGKMQSDGGDIRIINKSGSLVDYQIENGTINSSSTRIWFLSDIPSGEELSIYIYYGNSSASSPDYSMENLSYSIDGHEAIMQNDLIYAEADLDPDGSGWGFIDIHATGKDDIVNNHTFLFSRDEDEPYSVTATDEGPIYVELTFSGSGYNRNDGPLVWRLYKENRFIRWMSDKTNVSPGTYYWIGWDNSVLDTWESNGVTKTQLDGSYDFDNITYPYVREMRTSDNYSMVMLAPEPSINKASVSGHQTSNGSDDSMGLSHMTNDINLPWVDYWIGEATQSECEILAEKFSSLPSNSKKSEERRPAPVGYWSFDEGYGSTAHDESSQGNNGTINGATWKPESQCVSGKCLYFDGSDDYIYSPDDDSLDVSSGLTVSLWVKKSKNFSDIYRMIIGKDNYLPYGILHEPDSRGLRFDIQSESTRYGITSNLVLNRNEWTHVAYTYDSSTSKMFVYINGEEYINSTLSSSTIDSNSDPVSIGGKGSSRSFPGFIDEVKIYPYARTAEQIKADYNAGKAGAKSSKGVKMSAGGDPKSWMSDGLVGYWKMDEDDWNGTAGEVIDSSGNGNNGTASGGATTNVGKFGNGGEFDGSDDYVDTGITDNIQNGDFTVSLWMNPNTDGASSGRLVNKDPTGNGWSLSYGDPGNNRLRFFVRGMDDVSLDTGSIIDIGNWYHVIGVFDNTNNNRYLYVNGTLEAINMSDTGTPNINSAAIAIAAEAEDNTINFDGQIDEVRIYNRALSESEVKDLYLWAPGPVAHYNLDRGEGTTAYDISGNGNSGTFGGDPRWTPGKYGKALDFDGSDDYVDIPDSIVNLSGNYSISTWVNPNNNDQNPRWLSLIDGSNNLEVGHMNDDRVYFRFDNSTVGTSWTLDYGDWYHVNWVYDNGTRKIYVNGDEKSHSSGGISANANFSAIGAGYSQTSYTADGKIDEVKIYDYARTPRQIAMDYNGGKPVGWWKMDEGSGTDVHDYTDNVNHGTMVNMDSGTDWVEGKRNSALDFDGSDDYIEVPKDSSISFSGEPFTVSVWIKNGDDSQGGMGLVGNADYENGGFMLAVNDNDAEFIMNDDSSEYRFRSNNSALSEGEWIHFVGFFDGNTQRMYIDGVLIEEQSAAITDNNDDFKIGDGTQGGWDNFNGQIDDVRIYNYALTEDDIRRIYNGGAVNFN